jgi:hypothetical protein
MPKRALTALIVLAALGFGLLGGAHPCSAWQERSEAPAAAPSCHAGMKAETGESEHAGVPSHERDSSEGCGTSCKHACHMTAVAEAAPVAFAMAPVAQAVLEADGPGLALFVPPIDHIPLA